MKKRLLALVATVIVAMASHAQVSNFPLEWSFAYGFDNWTQISNNGEDLDNWAYFNSTQDGYTGYLMARCKFNLPVEQGGTLVQFASDEWLVSPAMTFDSAEYVLELLSSMWYAHLTFYVATGNTVADFLATTPVLDTSINNNYIIERQFILSGITPGVPSYVAIRYSSNYGDYGNVKVRAARIRQSGIPLPQLPNDTIVDINNEISIFPVITESNSAVCTWTSTMEMAGLADIDTVADTAYITYYAPGTDTLVVTATNATGSSTDTMIIRAYDFQTVTLPYYCDFESGDDGWIMLNSANGWYVGDGVSADGEQSLYISNDEGVTNSYNRLQASFSYAIRSVIVPTTDQYTYSYRWHCGGLTNGGVPQDYMRLYLAPKIYNLDGGMTVPMTSWIDITGGYLHSQAEWHDNVGVAMVPAGHYFIVAMWRNLGASSDGQDPAAAIDDFILTPLVCPAPSNLQVTATTTTSVTLSWTAGSLEGSWEYSVNGGEFVSTTSNPCTITDLTPGTRYNIRLRAACSDTAQSVPINVVAATECLPVSQLPWSEDFTTFSSMAFPPCWMAGCNTYNTNAYPFATNVDGNRTIRFSASAYPIFDDDYYSYAVLPFFSAPINSLEMSFDMRRYGSSSAAKLVVGVFNDAMPSMCDSCFDAIDSIETTGSGWHSYTVSFANYTGTGNRIVFFTDMNLSGPYDNDFYIDNVEVYPIPTCRKPENISLSDITPNSAVLVWDSVASLPEQYLVLYRVAGSENEWDEVLTEETSVELNSLEEGTTYEVLLRSLCSETDSSIAAVFSFHTLCVVDIFPFVEDFETGATCWTTIGTSSDDDVHWHVASGAGRSVSGSYAMFSHSSYSYWGSFDEWLISPSLIIPYGNPFVSLMWYSRNSQGGNYTDPYYVLASIGNPYDIATYTDTLAVITSDEEWTKHIVNISQYGGETIHIAFRHKESNGYDGVLIDDVYVGDAAMPVVHIEGAAVANVGYSVTFNAVLTEGSQEGVTYLWSSYMADAGDAYFLATEDSSQYVLVYTSNGNDVVQLIAINEYGTDTAEFNVVVRDLHTVGSLPYSTGFEDFIANTLWNLETDDNGWHTATATAADGEHSLYVSSSTDGSDNSYILNPAHAIHAYAYRGIRFAEAGNYVVSFDWHCDGLGSLANPSGRMRVYLVSPTTAITAGMPLTLAAGDIELTPGGNPSGFYGSDEWQNFYAELTVADTGVRVLVFEWATGTVGSIEAPAAAVDNLYVAVNSCPTPADLTVTANQSDTVVLHWTAVGSETQWEVVVGDNTPVIVNSPTYTATGLASHTTYNISVRAVCGAGDTSFAISTSVTTECVVITELPWTEDFDSYPSTPVETVIDCWEHTGEGAVTISVLHSVTDDMDDHSLRLLRRNNRDTLPLLLVLPEFGVPTANLEMSLYLMPDNAGSGKLQFGYITDPEDISTYVPTATYDAASDSMLFVTNGEFNPTRQVVNFDDAPEGARIAMRWLCESSYTYMWYVDSVTVRLSDNVNPHTCETPTGLTAARVADGIYTVTWTPVSEESQWLLELKVADNLYSYTVYSTPSYVLTGIDVSDSCRVRVKAVCGSTSWSEWSDYYTITDNPVDTNGISNVMVNNAMEVFPNPASSVVVVEMKMPASVAITDTWGREVYRSMDKADHITVDVNPFPAGIYYVMAITESGVVTSRLLIMR